MAIIKIASLSNYELDRLADALDLLDSEERQVEREALLSDYLSGSGEMVKEFLQAVNLTAWIPRNRESFTYFVEIGKEFDEYGQVLIRRKQDLKTGRNEPYKSSQAWLAELKSLYDKGYLDDAEYKLAKSRLESLWL